MGELVDVLEFVFGIDEGLAGDDLGDDEADGE